METLLIVQSIALLILAVSNVITVKTLKTLSENIASYKAVSDNQFRVVSRGIYKLNEKVETGQEQQKVFFNVNPVEKLTSEELIASLQQVFDDNRPVEPTFGELLQQHFKEEEAAKEAYWKAKSEANALLAKEKSEQVDVITPEGVKTMSKADAEQVLRDYATEKTIEMAEKVLEEKNAKPVKAKKVATVKPVTVKTDGVIVPVEDQK